MALLDEQSHLFMRRVEVDGLIRCQACFESQGSFCDASDNVLEFRVTRWVDRLLIQVRKTILERSQLEA